MKEKRTKNINLWYTDEEYKKLKENSQKMGLSMASYIRYKTIYEKNSIDTSHKV